MSNRNLIFATAGQAGAESDDDFANTVLLLHGDGTDGTQNNTFLDSSTNNFTITRNGNTTQGSFSPFSKPDGAWGLYTNGQRTTWNRAAFLALSGSTAYTIEFWMYPTAVGGIYGGTIYGVNVSGRGDSTWIAYTNTQLVGIQTAGAANYTLLQSVSTVPLNQWTHVAFTVSGASGSATGKVYLNGVLDNTVTNMATTIADVSDAFTGTRGDGSQYDYYGYLSNLRVVNGSIVYTATFTPPTEPLTAIANTSILIYQSNRLVNNGLTASALIGNAAFVTPFSPFPLTTAYSPSVNGGSGYFDESGDYINTPTDAAFQMGTGDFSIEAWIYPTKTPAGQYPIIFRFESGGYNGNGISFFWRRFNVNALGVSVDCGGVVGLAGTSTVPVGAWTHVAFTRTGNDFALFVNGVREATTNNSNNFSTNVPVYIGDGPSDSEFPGYISSARIVKGSNPYGVGTTLTVPTAPVTAITNTSLLCNFTNAGIFDNTGFNNLETVGNAQIDTTTKKYGTGSMEFDGTGDWLQNPNVIDFQFGTGDFTVECWVNCPSFSSNQIFIDARGNNNAATPWQLYINTSSKVVFNYGSNLTGSTSVSTNTWTHIAVARSGSSLKLFVNGTQDATATTSASISGVGGPFYIGRVWDTSGTIYLNGFIDDLRITKGVARYTSNFTVPDKAFADL